MTFQDLDNDYLATFTFHLYWQAEDLVNQSIKYYNSVKKQKGRLLPVMEKQDCLLFALLNHWHHGADYRELATERIEWLRDVRIPLRMQCVSNDPYGDQKIPLEPLLYLVDCYSRLENGEAVELDRAMILWKTVDLSTG